MDGPAVQMGWKKAGRVSVFLSFLLCYNWIVKCKLTVLTPPLPVHIKNKK
jgi:hypothetical protein